MPDTSLQFDTVVSKCTEIFKKKTIDYGTAWRILRSSSLTDQIFIKAQRIRSIELKGSSKINEGVYNEFVGIVNYSIIGLIQLQLGVSDESDEMDYNEVIKMFDNQVNVAKSLMNNPNKSGIEYLPWWWNFIMFFVSFKF